MDWILSLAASTCFSLLPIAATAQNTDRPLERLAADIPLHAEGVISLVDLAAIRRNMLIGFFPIDVDSYNFAPFSIVSSFIPFDGSSINQLDRGGISTFGFSIFDIEQIAGWGELPEVGLLMTGVPAQIEQLDTTLRTHNFKTQQRLGIETWFRGEDFAIDYEMLNDPDPFGAGRGQSQRFAPLSDSLLFSPTWNIIDQALTARSNLARDPNIVAIFDAAYRADHGDLIKTVFIQGQPIRSVNFAALIAQGNITTEQIQEALANAPGSDLAGLPFFPRYSILYWQRGARMTGALAIPYPTRETAELAMARFEVLLDIMPDSRDRPLAEVLDFERKFEVVESNGKFVTMLGFVRDLDPEVVFKIGAVRMNPAETFVQLFLYRDIDRLIGFAPEE